MIRVSDLSKDFRLPHLKAKTLKSHVLGRLRRSETIEVQRALRGITFEVEPGEFFGVVGRNGSGKSTLLKILAGIYVPTSGEVTIGGKLVPFIELGVGFNLDLTGRENVYLNGALLGFSKREMDAMYDDIVQFAEIEPFMDQKLKNYSSGMEVRLAFAVATRAQADILLIDEVLAVGDAAFQRKCYEYFRQLKKTKTTIVFVSHDMNAVREFCDRVILIEDSRLVAQGSAEDMAREYTRLFSAPAAKGGITSSSTRWGEGDIQYVSVTIPETVTDEAVVEVTLEARATKDVTEPVFGFLIRNSSGHPVLGTNTKLKRKRSGSLRAGENIRVRWLIPNVFSDGVHHFEPAIVDRDGVVVFDWWQEAAAFSVQKEEKSPYVVTPTMDVVLERDDAGSSD